MLNSSSILEHIKNTPTLEQFPLKTIWRLIERLFYYQGYKEIFTQSWVRREEGRSDKKWKDKEYKLWDVKSLLSMVAYVLDHI